ncbi:uncharacterized protein LOC128860910 [Anastrepha ludens]|uniref:uncharacterized protein LOC128860910 n=1 Tax=Anastrepha ludens TaxID=28586 RepID=UPI0023B05389|nr:uncharacterized protein LOC128860910 [Anastrepha ludens]
MCARTALDTSAARSKTTTLLVKQLSRFILNISILFTVFIYAVGEEAVLVPDDIEAREVVSTTDGPPCSIHVQKDLPKTNLPQPLYLRPNSSKYWLPNADGFLQIPRGQIIELTCTGPFANASREDRPRNSSKQQRTQSIFPRCFKGTTFLLNDTKYEFRDFVCARTVKLGVERTPQPCANNTAQLYRIGYNLTKDRFVETMQACYDVYELCTSHVCYTLGPANAHFQRGVKRWSFWKPDFYGSVDMNFLYIRKNQLLQAAKLLGSDEEALQYFNGRSNLFSRGHHAAKADMIYASQQRSTFTFPNVSPQWQQFNGGSWALTEDKVRSYVVKEKLEVICCTGTLGVMDFIVGNVSRPFYLTYDENNNGRHPVPKLFFRTISVVGNDRGIVILGVNVPYVTMDEIRENYIICEDVQDQVPWLSWMQNSGKKLKQGYLYACRVDEFVKAVPSLSELFPNVTELLV